MEAADPGRRPLLRNHSNPSRSTALLRIPASPRRRWGPGVHFVHGTGGGIASVRLWFRSGKRPWDSGVGVGCCEGARTTDLPPGDLGLSRLAVRSPPLWISGFPSPPPPAPLPPLSLFPLLSLQSLPLSLFLSLRQSLRLSSLFLQFVSPNLDSLSFSYFLSFSSVSLLFSFCQSLPSFLNLSLSFPFLFFPFLLQS